MTPVSSNDGAVHSARVGHPECSPATHASRQASELSSVDGPDGKPDALAGALIFETFAESRPEPSSRSDDDAARGVLARDQSTSPSGSVTNPGGSETALPPASLLRGVLGPVPTPSRRHPTWRPGSAEPRCSAPGVARIAGPEVDVLGAAAAISDLLHALGADPADPDLEDTPRRVARALADLVTPEPFDATTFPNACNYDGCVLVRDIEFRTLCMHHLLPFSGVAHVAYVPGDSVVGLSKLARAVDHFASDLQVQERLTVQIADWCESTIGALGAAVLISAEHSCMTLRGVRKPGASTVTSAFRGSMRDDPLRREFLDAIARR